MQLTARENYVKQMQKVQEELEAQRKKLKHQDKLDPKARKMLHKRIRHLYEELILQRDFLG